MDKFNLDLAVEIVEGSIHDLGDLKLIIRIWTSTFNPSVDSAKAVVIYRNADYVLTVEELRIGIGNLMELIDLLQALNLPEREPSLKGRAGNITGWQEISVLLTLNNLTRAFKVRLQYNGFEGESAHNFRDLLKYLFQVAGLNEQKFSCAGLWN